jgi:uncharacterized protein (TIGR03083 family)
LVSTSPKPVQTSVDDIIGIVTQTADDLRRATGRFAARLADADHRSKVPACPDWTVLDLVGHLGNVHTWAAGIGESGGPMTMPEERPDPDEMQPWYAARAGALVAALEAADPAAACWNFSRVHQTKGFWSRRQVHETQMHLVDLDQALGRPTRLDPEDCADGVTETFEVFLPRMHARGFPADLAAPASFVATDTGHSWTLTTADGTHPSLTLGDGVLAEDRVEGTAEELWLLLWKRADPDVVRTGDADRLARLLASRLTA